MVQMVIVIAFAFLIGLFLGFYLELCAARRSRRMRQNGKVSLNTYAKLATTVVIVHGMILTTLSYLLACFDKDPVVDVSTTIVREIVAPLIMYLATNTIMNIFEKNKMSFSVPIGSTFISKDRNNEHTEPEEAG